MALRTGLKDAQGTEIACDFSMLQKAVFADYDADARAAYLWNDDPASPDCGLFYSYDSEQSLDEKLRYIRKKGLGGLILWESGGDSADHAMLRRIHAAWR